MAGFCPGSPMEISLIGESRIFVLVGLNEDTPFVVNTKLYLNYRQGLLH